VLNDSRFGRFDDPEESTHWRFVLKRLGWIVRFAEGDEMEDGVARGVMRFIGAALASEYRAILKRTARRSARATAEEGRWQTRAPLGYRRLATRRDGPQRVLEDGQRKASDETVRLTPGPEPEQALVRFIFTEYASGRYSLGRLARRLHEDFPGRHWSNSTVQALLRNVAYLGDVYWCRRPHDAAERRETPVRDRSQWVTVRDAHQPLVSRELFAQVEARLATNRVERRATTGGYPLSGFVQCAECGGPFVGGGGRKGPDDDPDRYRFYVDRGGLTRRAGEVPQCTGRLGTLRKRWLETRVVHEIARVVGNPRVQSIIGHELDRALAEAVGSSDQRRDALEAEQRDVERRRGRLVSAIATGVLDEREAASAMAELRAKSSALAAELERTRFAERRTVGMSALRDRLIALASDFETQALRCSGGALRELVRPWLAGASLNKHERVLTLRIRRVPDILGMESSNTLARDSS
jgi:hypothetical protein